MAETATMSPKARPQNLPALSAPKGKSPIALSSTDPGKVFEWAESVRDEFQGKGQRLTARGLLVLVKNSVADDGQGKKIRNVIRDIYKEELAAEPKPSTGKPAKAAKKASAKPSANGKAPKKAGKKKAAAAPRPATESETIFEKTVRGVPVLVTQSETGKRRTTVNGQPAREVLRWMGSVGFDVPAAKKAMATLFAGLDDPDYVDGFCSEGHVGSGAKGQKGVFGAFESPEPAVAKALKALKK